MNLTTPYYLIDEKRLLKNLRLIQYIRRSCGVKFVLALKCFSSWSVFPLIRKYMDGTTSSSLYETRLGKEKFLKETHAYSVAFSKEEVMEVVKYADKIIFNSLSQLKKFKNYLKGLEVGIRINPGISYSGFDLANPARRFSRLGISNMQHLFSLPSFVSGAMFHFNCENSNFKNFCSNIDLISKKYHKILKRLQWVSLGGGIHFTGEGYPIDAFCRKLKKFSDRFNVQIYLEPGEAVITNTAELVTKVLDIVHNEIDIAIVDSSVEAHMLDLLVYRQTAKIKNNSNGKFKYMIAGRSCLAADIFGTFRFKTKLKIDSIIRIPDAAGYTMVKKNWFNGLQMPSIVVKRLDGSVDIIRKFGYKDFLNSLS